MIFLISGVWIVGGGGVVPFVFAASAGGEIRGMDDEAGGGMVEEAISSRREVAASSLEIMKVSSVLVMRGSIDDILIWNPEKELERVCVCKQMYATEILEEMEVELCCSIEL